MAYGPTSACASGWQHTMWLQIKPLRIDTPAGTIHPTHQLLVRVAHSAAESVLPSSACAVIYGVMPHVHISNTTSSTNVIVELDGLLQESKQTVVISMKNALIDPVTFQYKLSTPFDPKTTSFLRYSIPIPSLNTLGSFVFFELCCGQTDRQTEKQTNKQTDGAKHSTHADRLCQRGYIIIVVIIIIIIYLLNAIKTITTMMLFEWTKILNF